MNNLQYFSKQIAVGLCLVSLGFTSLVEGEEEDQTQSTKSSDNTLLNDFISFPYTLSISNTKCIPAKATIKLGENSNTEKYSIYRPKRALLGGVLESRVDSDDSCTGSKELKIGEAPVTIDKSSIIERDASRFGWKYGALIAPYKYYKSSHTVKGSTTIAPYAGWKFDSNSSGFEIAPILFSGPAMIEATDSNGNTSSLFGISIGVGLLFELNDEFNIGALYGYDVVNKSEDFADNGRPWVSLSIGYNLSN